MKNPTNNRVKILSIPFDKVTMESAVCLILEKLKNHKEKNHQAPFFVATPNPEMLLEANKNQEFKKILNNTDLNIPDGFGVILASHLSGNPLLQRVTGTDLMQKICECAPTETKIFLLGAAPGVAQKTAEILEKKYPQIIIAGTHSGSPAEKEEAAINKMINQSGAEVLFVAFGAPKQELWLAKNLPKLRSIKIAIGVGGAFDFISGIRKRAPLWMQRTGLEWLFRLIIEPTRLKRIINATIAFPIVFLFGKKTK